MFKKAVPVWAKEYVNEKNIMLEFSNRFLFEGKFAKIRIAADALYRLYINGTLVSHGPQRAGKGFWRVDEIDLTHKLIRGEYNNIALQVHSYGLKSFEYVLQPGFLMAEVEVDGNVVLYTDIDSLFSAKRVLSREQMVERYSYQRPAIEVWKLPHTYSETLQLVKVDNIVVKPRTAPYPELRSIPFVTLEAKGEATIKENEKCQTRVNNTQLEDFAIDDSLLEKIYRDELINLKTNSINHISIDIKPDYSFILEENEFETLKLPYENSGFISCDFECIEDSTVYFIYDEILIDGDLDPMKHSQGSCTLTPVYLKPGKHSFISIEPRTLQYLKVLSVKGSVKISNIRFIEYINSKARTAVFECDDDALNRIYNAAVHTFEQNAVDLFTDCPHRERAGWLCDSFFTARTEKDITGTSAVEKGFLENFFYATDFSDIPDGMLPMCYPSTEATRSFIPNWAMFLVIELEEYVQRTGDTAILDAARERLYKLEDYFCNFLNEDGLLEKLKGWVFVEWSQANKWVQDVNFPSNMMYYAMLKSMARMYNDAALDDKAERIKATIKKLSYNGTFFRDHQIYDENGNKITPEDITEVCQYYAFFTHVADKETYPQLIETIANDFGAGHKCEKTHQGVFAANAFIGNYLRMEVLSQNGFRKQIIGEIKEYFDYMAKLTGTLWENDSTSASCNHGFASHVIRFIFRDCLGLQQVDEINKKIYLNSDYNAPECAKAIIPLANGNIKITVEGGARKVEITGDYTIG